MLEISHAAFFFVRLKICILIFVVVVVVVVIGRTLFASKFCKACLKSLFFFCYLAIIPTLNMDSDTSVWSFLSPVTPIPPLFINHCAAAHWCTVIKCFLFFLLKHSIVN